MEDFALPPIAAAGPAKKRARVAPQFTISRDDHTVLKELFKDIPGTTLVLRSADFEAIIDKCRKSGKAQHLVAAFDQWPEAVGARIFEKFKDVLKTGLPKALNATGREWTIAADSLRLVAASGRTAELQERRNKHFNELAAIEATHTARREGITQRYRSLMDAADVHSVRDEED